MSRCSPMTGSERSDRCTDAEKRTGGCVCVGIVNPMRRGDDDTEQIPKMQGAAKSAGSKWEHLLPVACYPSRATRRVLPVACYPFCAPADTPHAHGPSIALNAESTRAKAALDGGGLMQHVLLQRELK